LGEDKKDDEEIPTSPFKDTQELIDDLTKQIDKLDNEK